MYPWGKDPDPNRANYGGTGIRSTSAVGCFPGGASRYGVEEMSGNVWEWTRSLWWKERGKEYGHPYDPRDGREDLKASDAVPRVVRGGSFLSGDYGKNVRCATRVWILPYSRDIFLGFRVVVLPLSVDGSTIDR